MYNRMKNQNPGKKSLIVNADDFGLASFINKGIIEAVEKGAVNSVSLVANGDALDEAINYIKKKPELKTGIHFTLIDEKPVSDKHLVPSLVTKDGFFWPGYTSFILRYITGKINLQEVKIELSAQVQKLADKGVHLMHCDSHQHMHLLKNISDIVLKLCQKHGIKRIRTVNETPSCRYWKNIIPLIVMNYFSCRLKNLAKPFNIESTDRFLGFNTSMNVNRHIIKKALHLSENFSVELMCHPGRNSENTGRYKKWSMDWDRERNTIIKYLHGKFS